MNKQPFHQHGREKLRVGNLNIDSTNCLGKDNKLYWRFVLDVNGTSLIFVAQSLSIISFLRSRTVIFYLKYQQALESNQYNKF